MSGVESNPPGSSASVSYLTERSAMSMSPADELARLTDSEPPVREERRALRRICAWCPDFDPTDPINSGATHTICPDCAQRVRAAELRRQS